MLDKEKIEQVIDEEVRPILMRDGGNIELIKVENNDVHVRLQGACAHCIGAIMTLKQIVEVVLKDKFPQLENVINET